MVNTPQQAIAAAEHTLHNIPGTCQFQVRTWLDAPSVGDFDGDGAADAEDGWKSEPQWARHTDKVGKPGRPASFVGGANDFGHRALFVRRGILRSTDFDTATKQYKAGTVGEGTVDQVAAAMNVTWAGWSDTIDGVKIPVPPPTRGLAVDRALKRLKRAERRAAEGTKRDNLLDRSISLIKKIPFLNR